jgi:hypothetical protein
MENINRSQFSSEVPFLHIRQRYGPNNGYHYYKQAASVSRPLHKFALPPYCYNCLWEFMEYEHNRV